MIGTFTPDMVDDLQAMVKHNSAVGNHDRDWVDRIYTAIASGGDDEFMAMVVIPGSPPSKKRPRFTKFGTTYQPKDDRLAEVRTADFLRAMVDEPHTGNVALGCVFFRPSYQRIDTDNMLKHVSDSANGVLWVDDSQVTALIGFTELDPEMPRTIVVLTRHHSTMRRGSDLVRPCEICGKDMQMIGKNPSKRSCSKVCTTRLKGHVPLDALVPCPQCGGMFTRKQQYQQLCSVECRAARIAGSNRRRAHLPLSECMDCGKTLTHRHGGRCRDCWRKSMAEIKAFNARRNDPVRVHELEGNH